MNKINEFSVVFLHICFTFQYFFPLIFLLLCLIPWSITADKGNQKNKEKNRKDYFFPGTPHKTYMVSTPMMICSFILSAYPIKS